jgi:hypothetical protein
MGRLAVAVEDLEVDQVDMRWMRLLPRALLTNEVPDLDISKARTRLRVLRVKSLAIDRLVDRRTVKLQLRAGAEGECPRPNSRLGR